MMRAKRALQIACVVVLALAVSACGDAAADTPLESSDTVASSDTVEASDAEELPTEDQSILNAFPPVESILAVIDTLAFAGEVEPGITPGFDLDGVVSNGSDQASCGAIDFEDVNGTPGIDNQAALLVPLFDLVGFGAIGSFIQGAVEEGGFLLMWEIEGIDDLAYDDEVTIRMRFGSGVPLLGTDGRIVSGQSFHLHEDSPDQILPTGQIVDGVLEAGPFDTFLPIVVFGVFYEIDVRGAYIRGRLTYDGGIEDGVLGGGVTLQSLLELAETADNEADGIYDKVKLLTEGLGDMMPDENGECQAMSSSLIYSAVPAFFYPGEAD